MMTTIRKTVLTAAAVLLLATTTTATATPSREVVLAAEATCAAPPCTTPAVTVGGGFKTITAVTTAGTATAQVWCRFATGGAPAEFVIAELTGADCTATPAGCSVATRAWCDQMFLTLTACADDCRVNAWLRREPQRP